MRRTRYGLLLAPVVTVAFACACGTTKAVGPWVLAVGPGADCVSLGNIRGEGSGGSLVRYEDQVEWATQQALDKAKAMGATHVVLEHEDRPGVTLWVLGYAYRCP
jgi:hypothetical protein